MTSEPRVVISILNWNGAEKTLACLRSLKVQTYRNAVIRVVDNGSVDDSCERISSAYPDVMLLRNPENTGFAAGHNVVLRKAHEGDADYVWILNSDAEVHADALAALVALSESDSAIGLVSPVIYDRSDTSRVQFCGSWLDWDAQEVRYSREFAAIEAREKVAPGDMSLWGTALLIKREVLERVGMLDENFFAYYEDNDYCVRAARCGFFSRVAPSAMVRHDAHRSTRTRPPYFFYLMARNAYFFWMKHLPAKAQSGYRLRHLARTIREAASCRDNGGGEQAHACLAGLVDAWSGVGGPPRVDRALPYWLRRGAMASPYLTAAALEGDMRRVLDVVRNRLKRAS